jgi:hypothetical protein
VAARGTTFAKQERDRAKKAKAALKRERREGREQAEPAPAPEISGEGEIAPDELLRLVKELHDAYADERISLEEFEERKQELMARITV